jgi:homoserine kinase
MELIQKGLADVLIEPRRMALIPGFSAVKKAALGAGALGASISGAGPSVFAWCDGAAIAESAARGMRQAFAAAGLDSDILISPVAGPAAEVIACAT